MRLAITGFVAENTGSIAGANAILLRGLLDAGIEVDFFSKASFVDPRPSVGDRKGFHFYDVQNGWANGLGERMRGNTVLSFAGSRLDASTYNRALVQAMSSTHQERDYAACLWLGDYARGHVVGVPTISFVQGPPGTDARSIRRRFQEVKKVAGAFQAWKLRFLAALRLSRWGLPDFSASDFMIVGSSQSRGTLVREFGVAPDRVGTLPYPIDASLFRQAAPREAGSRMTALWLGRIVPRKRLDLFLDGCSLAIDRGLDLQVVIAGSCGLVSGYEKMIDAFPYPGRLEWKRSVERADVPALFDRVDVLVQPSEEEDFGSSAAEAQISGRAVILGSTNGNRDYASPADIVLSDDHPRSLADALASVADRRFRFSPSELRDHALRVFDPPIVVARFLDLLRSHVPA